ncbi:MAG: hypothetical protein V7638_1633 [Acidobacteriota bacterium]|jgi:hypothetical protein
MPHLTEHSIPLFFSLHSLVKGGESSGTPQASALKPGVIQAGQRMTLKVSVSSVATPNQLPVKVGLPATIILLPVADEAIRRSVQVIDNYRVLSSIDALANLQFEISTEENCPSGELELNLLVLDEERNPTPAAKIKAKIEGKEIIEQRKTVFEECYIDFDASFPENVAILYVEQLSGERLQLTGFDSRHSKIQDFKTISDFFSSRDYVHKSDSLHPQRTLEVMKFKARSASEILTKWLKELFGRYKERFCLIVCDLSASRINWEALAIEDDEYIGALGVVTRWLPLRYYDHRTILRVEADRTTGNTIAYVDNGLKETAEKEKETLRDLVRVEAHESVDALLRALSGSLSSVGLVYLASHGTVTFDLKHQNLLQSVAIGTDTKQLLHLDVESISRKEDPRPVIFINACNSALLFVEGNSIVGWPEVALTRLASAYLGTLGLVGSEYAASVSARIFTSATQDCSGANLPAILKEIRKEAIEAVANNRENEEKLKHLIYSFMYIYYGNPLSTVTLRVN